MATGSSGKSSQVIVLQLLTPGVKPPQAPSPDGGAGLPSSRCSGGWCPLERGPFGEERSCAGRRPRRRWRSVSPGTRAERVRRCRTLALGWVGFFCLSRAAIRRPPGDRLSRWPRHRLPAPSGPSPPGAFAPSDRADRSSDGIGGGQSPPCLGALPTRHTFHHLTASQCLSLFPSLPRPA